MARRLTQPIAESKRLAGAASAGSLLILSLMLLVVGEASSNAMPRAFGGGDIVATLKEIGRVPIRTVSCVGPQGSGKSTLMRSLFAADTEAGVASVAPKGLALLEARSDSAYMQDSNYFAVGTGKAMISLAVSDVMIYNVMVHDLARPNAFSDLQPALEELLALYEDGVVDPELQKTVVIAVRDCEEGTEADLEKAIGERLDTVWAATVKPKGFTQASLDDIVSLRVYCLPHYNFASEQYLAEVGKLKHSVVEGQAETPAVEVARLLQQVASYAGPATESVGTKAVHAAFVAAGASARCLSSFKALLGRLSAGFTELNTEFGELCDGVFDTVLDEYDQAVGGVSGSKGVLSKKKTELKRSMLQELGVRHAGQLALLRKAAREQFESALSGLRVNPDVGKQMEDAVQKADKFFVKTAKGMNSRHQSFPTGSVRKELMDEMREFASERLQLVQAQGGMINMKRRRPVGMSFHWLLPGVFGAEVVEDCLTEEDERLDYGREPEDSSPMFLDILAPGAETLPVKIPFADVPNPEDIAKLKKEAKGFVQSSALYADVPTLEDMEKLENYYRRQQLNP